MMFGVESFKSKVASCKLQVFGLEYQVLNIESRVLSSGENIKLKTQNSKLILILSLCLFINSCGIYSFSGASIPKEVKTISIEYVQNKAPNAWTSIDRIFNQSLRNKLVRDAGLKLVDQGGDYHLKGVISSYQISPQTATQGQFSNAYRLEITVNMEFEDKVSEKKHTWSQSFVNFEVYENDIQGQEDKYIEKISDNISNSIFNKIFSTW